MHLVKCRETLHALETFLLASRVVFWILTTGAQHKLGSRWITLQITDFRLQTIHYRFAAMIYDINNGYSVPNSRYDNSNVVVHQALGNDHINLGYIYLTIDQLSPLKVEVNQHSIRSDFFAVQLRWSSNEVLLFQSNQVVLIMLLDYNFPYN